MLQLADCSFESLEALQACNGLWEGVPLCLLISIQIQQQFCSQMRTMTLILEMKQMFAKFPGIIFMDNTYIVRPEGYILIAILVEDQDGSGKPVAYRFMRRETKESLEKKYSIFCEQNDTSKVNVRPAISHCSHLLLKMLSGYKYKSLAKCYSLGDSTKLHICEKVYFHLAFGFSNIAFIILSHFIIVPYFTLWMLDFFNTIQVSNSLDPDQAQQFDRPDLGPSCLQRLSADNKSRP